MKDPGNYFENLFFFFLITVKQMAALTTDHIGKLRNQDKRSGGQWNARLAATVEAMAEFDHAISDDMTQADFRKARKLTKNRFRRALPRRVRAIVNWVVAEYGETSPQVTAIVGSGTTPLRSLPDDEVENYLKKVITGLKPLVATVGQKRLDEAEALKAEWAPIYAASEQATTAKRLAEERLRAAKAALSDVLFVTLLEIIKAHRHRPEVLGNFFTPSLAGGRPLRPRR